MIDPDAPYWLALLTDSRLPRTVAKSLVLRCCIQEGRPLRSLLDVPPAELMAQYMLSAEAAGLALRALQTAPGATVRLDAWEERGIDMMLRVDVAYPESLGERLAERWVPYFFFRQGDPVLLSEPGLCILGGRRPGAEAMARELGHALAERGFSLWGGYDQGADRAALDAARQAGAPVTMVLPLGLNHFAGVARGMQAELTEGRLLLLSPVEPDTPYSQALAEARQIPLAAMAEALILVGPERPPAAWATLPDFLVADKRLFIWSGTEAEMARAWIERGATPFDGVGDLLQRLGELFGPGASDAASAARGAEQTPSAEEAIDALPDVEPIAFADADSAIEALSVSGRVPDILARRLREMEWPNDLDYLAQHDDLDIDAHDDQPVDAPHKP